MDGSPSAVISLGFGSWGSSGLTLTLGFGVGSVDTGLVGTWSNVITSEGNERITAYGNTGRIEASGNERIEVR